MAEVTNYIDRLVAELCPDGVEYRPLSDVVEKNYGGGTPSKAKEEYWGGDIPWASVGDLSNDLMEIFDTRSKITPAGVSGSSTNVVPAGAVIVAIKIAPGKMKIAGVDLAINQDIRGLVLNDLMNARFLTYYFRTLMFAGHGTIVKSITNKRLMDTEVPVPPLEIQEAIVEILDKFTNLEAELEAELEARTLQYEYYRDLLLASFSEPAVKFYSIEELFTTRNGYTPSKSNSSYWENGTVPWFRMEDIRENGGVLSEALQSVHESALKKGGMFPAGSIIVATSATIGEHALINVDFLCNQRFTVLTPKEEFKSLLLPKFLYYYSFVLDRWCLSNTTQSSFASVDMKRFKKFEFPLPSLEEQQRIVDILDRFDALTSSLSEGLPAELTARRSQYEYYRDQLLSFPRKGETQ